MTAQPTADQPAPDKIELDPTMQLLRNAVRFAYDLQKMRIGQSNRAGRQADHAQAHLDDAHRVFLGKTSEGLEGLEKESFREVKRILRQVPIYTTWLDQQKGVGPAMAGVLVSYFNPYKAPTPSSFVAFAGLSVDVRDGRAARRRRGEKANFNPFLKAKMLEVLGSSFLKANSPWRYFYDNYLKRKQHQVVDVCMACQGQGKVVATACVSCKASQGYNQKVCACGSDAWEKSSAARCQNCAGTGGPAPWGASKKHRHRAAMRYMVKMFLVEFWLQWRALEGLPLRSSYASEMLNRPHHDDLTPGQTVDKYAHLYTKPARAA